MNGQDSAAAGTAGEADLRPRLWSRVALVVVLSGLAALWGYALLGPRSDPPGTLDDPAFGQAAEPVCAATSDRLSALTPAHESPTPEARAEVIRAANELLSRQTSTLEEIQLGTAEDARRVREWLADWRTYLEDRERYARRLDRGEDAPFVESAKDGDHISEALAFFARINGMPSCAPAGDV